MSQLAIVPTRRRRVCFLLATFAIACSGVGAQPNPYVEAHDWLQPPENRPMGRASSVYTDADGNVWVVERCGQNSCVDRDDDSPIHVYDRGGRWIKSFGRGLFASPPTAAAKSSVPRWAL